MHYMDFSQETQLSRFCQVVSAVIIRLSYQPFSLRPSRDPPRKKREDAGFAISQVVEPESHSDLAILVFNDFGCVYARRIES
jgi:hypothetical protein